MYSYVYVYLYDEERQVQETLNLFDGIRRRYRIRYMRMARCNCVLYTKVHICCVFRMCLGGRRFVFVILLRFVLFCFSLRIHL